MHTQMHAYAISYHKRFCRGGAYTKSDEAHGLQSATVIQSIRALLKHLNSLVGAPIGVQVAVTSRPPIMTLAVVTTVAALALVML